jgi:hypothetical protein
MMAGPSRPATELTSIAANAMAALRFSSAMSGTRRLTAEPTLDGRCPGEGLLSA